MAINVALARLAIRMHALHGRGIGDAPPTYHVAANAAIRVLINCVIRNHRITHEYMQHE